ncbi:MAG: MOSC domain-containing protein [Pseudomonadota bacterium]
MTASITTIARYPVKGFSPQLLDTVEVKPGLTLPFDRTYAIAHAASKYDPANPTWLRKAHFLQLMRYEKLATLTTEFDDQSHGFTIQRDGKQVARGALSQPIGRKLIEQFLNAYLDGAAPVPVKVIAMEDQAMTDNPNPYVSIINLASLRDLERLTLKPVDWRRFRGNLMIDGIPAWSEFDWVGSDVTVGSAKGKIIDRIDRCAATTVNPDTGDRDIAIVQLLRSGYDHIDCGVFLELTKGGTIAVGDGVSLTT